MKVAVTIWGKRISPVFDSSRMLLIVEIKDREIIDRKFIAFNPDRPSHLLALLIELDISVLICGAVSQMPANFIEAGGIKLIPFITGNAEEIITLYAKDADLIPTFLMPGCRRQYCQKQGSRLGETARQKEGQFMPKQDGTGFQGKGSGTGRCPRGRQKRGLGQGQGQGRCGQGQGQGQGRTQSKIGGKNSGKVSTGDKDTVLVLDKI